MQKVHGLPAVADFQIAAVRLAGIAKDKTLRLHRAVLVPERILRRVRAEHTAAGREVRGVARAFIIPARAATPGVGIRGGIERETVQICQARRLRPRRAEAIHLRHARAAGSEARDLQAKGAHVSRSAGQRGVGDEQRRIHVHAAGGERDIPATNLREVHPILTGKKFERPAAAKRAARAVL